MSVKINVKRFQPTLECRYFADLTLLKFWKYNFDKVDLLGLSGSFCFVYAKVKVNTESFFSIFSRRPKLLQRISLFLNGEYFENYDGSVDDLYYLTENIGIPVVVRVDFTKFKNYYLPPVRSMITINIERLSRFNIIHWFPHEIVVIGCKNGKVICFDNLTVTNLEISIDDFVNMWEMPSFEYGGAKKKYLEYISIPYSTKFEKNLFSLATYSLECVMNSFFTMYPDADAVDKRNQYLLGEQAINQFKKDIQKNKFTENAYNFSVAMISELDKNFWKGLERESFAAFLKRYQQRYSEFLGNKKDLLEQVINLYCVLARKWRTFFSTIIKFEKAVLLQNLDDLAKKEQEAGYLLSEMLA